MLVLCTERLRLRWFDADKPGDAEFILELLNEPSWLQNIGDRNVHSLDAARAFITDRLVGGYWFQGFGFWAVERAEDGALPIVALSPDWEGAFADALVGPGEDKQLALAPSKLQAFIAAVRDAFDRAAQNGEAAVLLTSPAVRPYVRSLIERFRGQTPVLSQGEIHPRVKLRTVGMV